MSPVDWALANSWASAARAASRPAEFESVGDLGRACRLGDRQAERRDDRWLRGLTNEVRRKSGKRFGKRPPAAWGGQVRA